MIAPKHTFTKCLVAIGLLKRREPKRHVNRARFEECIINGEIVRINARCLPDDLPGKHEWTRTKYIYDNLRNIPAIENFFSQQNKKV